MGLNGNSHNNTHRFGISYVSDDLKEDPLGELISSKNIQGYHVDSCDALICTIYTLLFFLQC